MVGPFRHDHLRQQAGSRRALLDRLRRLGGAPHRAVAGVLQANVLDHLHRRGNVLIAFAGLFRDQPQVLAAALAMLIRFRQVVNDAFALQIPRQRLTTATLRGWRRVRFRRRSRVPIQVVIIVGGLGVGFRTPRLPGRLEQRQLLFRQLLALAVALRLQQFAQQLWYLFCSASERSSCSARSTTIFRSVSESRGKVFGSMATVGPDYAKNGP